MKNSTGTRKRLVLCSLVSLTIGSLEAGVVLAQEVPNATVLTTQSSTTDLTVDANKTLAIDFGALGAGGLLVKGDLNNSGTIFAYTSDPI